MNPKIILLTFSSDMISEVAEIIFKHIQQECYMHVIEEEESVYYSDLLHQYKHNNNIQY